MAKCAKAFGLLCLVLLLLVFTLTATQGRLGSPAVSAEATENSWMTRAPMQQARSGLGVAVVNGKIYAIGGFAGGGLWPPFLDDRFVGTNEEYDSATDTWAVKTPMPTPRAYFAIAVYQNKIYCIGGTTGVNPDTHQYILPGVNEVYDPATDTWENKASMPTARWLLSANVVGGKIYLIGGQCNGSLIGINEVYDPAADSWTTKSSMLTAAQSYASAVVDDNIYVIGGYSNIPGSESNLNNLNQVYDTENDSWSLGAPAPNRFHEGSAGVTSGVMAPKRIYIMEETSTQVYDPEDNSWTVGAVAPTSRFDMGIAVINDTLYEIGGYTVSVVLGPYVVPSAINEQYTPFGYGSDFTAPKVSVLSPRNETYHEANVSLSFTVDEPASLMGYSLDGQDNVTVTANTTLTCLTNGSHNLTIYATDAAGNTGASETISFAIAQETQQHDTEPQPESFPATWVAASLLVVAAVSVGFIVYFRKRKH